MPRSQSAFRQREKAIKVQPVSPIYTMTEAAKRLRKSHRWLQDFIRENPTDWNGRPYYTPIGRTKTFDDDDIRHLKGAIGQHGSERRERNVAAKNDDGYVYFIETGEFIKIGFTRSPRARSQRMFTDNPVAAKVLHAEPGTFKTEKIFHREFSALRVRGEWFRKTPEILAFIETRKRICGGLA